MFVLTKITDEGGVRAAMTRIESKTMGQQMSSIMPSKMLVELFVFETRFTVHAG